MIRYSIDSTLTLRETPVFKTGQKGCGVYDRKNTAADGFTLSNQSKRKIKQYISGYFLENNHLGKNISWVTLTIPPRLDGYVYQEWCDDPKIIKQLSRFLENLRKNHGLKNYVWVAERQDGKRNDYKHCTGAIHFHCIFDFEKFVSYPNLNLYWIKLLNSLGYMAFSSDSLLDKIKKGYFSIEKTYDRYEKTTFHHIARASIDRHDYKKFIKKICDQELNQCLEILKTQNFRTALNGIDPMTLNSEHPFCKIAYQPYEGKKIEILDFSMLQTYLTKYVTKNETKIHGRVWGASRGFTSVNYEINISSKQASQLKLIKDIVICEKESSFEIGINKYYTKSTKLDHKIFEKTTVFEKLMDHIITQRLNPVNSLPEHIQKLSAIDQVNFVSDVFQNLRSQTYFVNDETRVESIIYPLSTMPLNLDFDNQNDGFKSPGRKVKSLPPVQFELFEFIDLDKKQLK